MKSLLIPTTLLLATAAAWGQTQSQPRRSYDNPPMGTGQQADVPTQNYINGLNGTLGEDDKPHVAERRRKTQPAAKPAASTPKRDSAR